MGWLTKNMILMLMCAMMPFLLSAGCVASKIINGSRAGVMHTVQWEGETLSFIAEWYTGNFNNWQAISDANSKVNPKRLMIGDMLLVPEHLVTNRKPMPKKYIRKVGVQKEAAPLEEKKAETLLPFGPKD